MKAVIFAVSKKGAGAACETAKGLIAIYGEDGTEVEVYIKSKYIGEPLDVFGSNIYYLEDNEDMSGYAHRAFSEADALIFVCACGIAVRMIAPCVKDKAIDPAVLVLDEGMSYCIPILSGHLGGANDLALKLSEQLKCTPVITTASDTRGLTAVDTFAGMNRLFISDLKKAGDHTAALLNGESLFVKNETCDPGFLLSLPEGYLPYEEDGPDSVKIIRISYVKNDSEALTLIPKCLRVGIGCRRGVSKDKIKEAFEGCFNVHGLYKEAVKGIFSIDLKADEEGLLEFCNEEGYPVTFYSADFLKGLEGDFSGSDFVNEITGVDNVCERSALAGGGRLLVGKEKYEGVTVAVAVCFDE